MPVHLLTVIREHAHQMIIQGSPCVTTASGVIKVVVAEVESVGGRPANALTRLPTPQTGNPKIARHVGGPGHSLHLPSHPTAPCWCCCRHCCRFCPATLHGITLLDIIIFYSVAYTFLFRSFAHVFMAEDVYCTHILLVLVLRIYIASIG